LLKFVQKNNLTRSIKLQKVK